MNVEVKIVNKSKHDLPKYQTEGSAGMDLTANLNTPVTLGPLERKLIPTGIFIELPLGYEAQIRPRSGISIKRGLTMINAVGTIDSDYRGELMVPIVNLSNETQIIEDGERIAQMVISTYSTAKFILCDELSSSERGAGGFGHTGLK